jgi:hypothetical protein
MSNVYVGYSPNDFFYEDTKSLKDAAGKTVEYLPDLNVAHDTVTLTNTEGKPGTAEGGNLKIKDLSGADCTSYFGDHKLSCIKNQIYKNKENVDLLNAMDISHNSAYAKNSGNAEEFQDVFLNTMNLSIGILFILFVIFKIQNIKK